MNVKEKLQEILAAANNTTSAADTDITAAVRSLIDGYGQGGGIMPAPPGYELVTNEFDIVLSSDSNPDIAVEHGLGVLPAYILCTYTDWSQLVDLEKNILVSGIWASGGNFLNGGYVISGHFKRENEHVVREELGNHSYYINSVNDKTFSVGYDPKYSWPGGYQIHVACFGFKKVVK